MNESDPNRVSPEEAGTTCSWCGDYIPEDVPVFGMGAKMRPGMRLEEYDGSISTEPRPQASG